MNTAGWDKLYVFSNCAIEQYTTAVYADFNRRIIPKDHVPDMELVDFFKAVFDAFNIRGYCAPGLALEVFLYGGLIRNHGDKIFRVRRRQSEFWNL